jgi:hypothetical protein
MKFTNPASILLAFPLIALADVEFTSPEPGVTVHGGDVLTAVWKDSGEPPKILELTDYDLFLCAGGSSVEYSVCSLEYLKSEMRKLNTDYSCRRTLHFS